jgi:NAD(P)-dependent dehydrogenase (short-subunit alcohol dehydrogenase family)
MGDPLQDKIVLVTGRSTGIGLGIAKRFVSERANRIGFNMSDQLTLVLAVVGL